MDKKQFMQNIYSKDKELNAFLNNKFRVSKNDTSQSDVEKNINSLKDLSELEKKIAKARLIQLEENNDVSKFFPSIIAITAALLVVINTISSWIIKGADLKIIDQKERIKESGNSLSNFDSLTILTEELFSLLPVLITALILIIYLTYKFSKNSNHRSTAVYINALLADTLNVEKEDSTKRTESEKSEDEKRN